MNLNELLALLDQPDRLKREVSMLRSSQHLPFEILGFIELYDKFNGDSEKIKNYLEEVKEVSFSPSQKKWQPLIGAAVFIGIISVSIVGFILFQQEVHPLQQAEAKPTNEEFLIEPGIPTFLSSTPKLKWEKVMFPYKQGNYDIALHELIKLEKQVDQNDTVYYFKGVIYLKKKQKELSIYNFKQVLKKESVFTFRSTFYLAQIAWENGEKKEVLNTMKSLKKCKDPSVVQAANSFLNNYSAVLN